MPEHARTPATMWMVCACVNCVHHSVFFVSNVATEESVNEPCLTPSTAGPYTSSHLACIDRTCLLGMHDVRPHPGNEVGGRGRTLPTETPLTTRNPSTHCSTRFLMTIHIGLDFIRRCALEQRRTPSERVPRTAQVQGDVQISVGGL